MENINIEDYGLSLEQPKLMRRSNTKVPEIGEIIGKWKILTGPLRGKHRWGAICECQCEYKTRRFNVYNKLFTKESQSCGCLKEDNAKGSRLKNGIKKCARCGLEKTAADFTEDNSHIDGLLQHCKECEHLRSLLKKFKLDKTAYLQMIDQQEEKCKICGKEQSSKRLAVDHCHTSGRIRGLLCNNCNSGLGMFNDNPELLQKAIDYLNQN